METFLNPEPEKPLPLVRLSAIRKSFPGVQAVRSGDLELLAGEIHALVGENGAGKSTLIKILTGVYQAEAGEVQLYGHPVAYASPIEAQAAGMATIYQEFALFPALTVRENLFVGREKTRKGFFSRKDETAQAKTLLNRLGVQIDPEVRVRDLNVAQQQLVEIARILGAQARILIMDEPSAALTPREVEKLFRILKELKAQGIGIIFISHRLDEVFTVADRVTVMRDGLTVGTWATRDITRKYLIEQMVGRPLDQEFPRVTRTRGAPCLEVRNLSGGKVRNVTFTVRHGEVLGLAGLMGAGRTDVARMLFGADPRIRGDIVLDDKPLNLRSPSEAIAEGICLLTEDRKAQGLVLKASAKDNFALPNLPAWSHGGWIDQKHERVRFYHHVQSLTIRVSGPDQLAQNLSGGNQQKLLVARWLEKQSQVLIFDEPTRGIDVGAKYDMYLLINELAVQGKALIVISSELPEILGICDRVLVMREGQITGEIPEVGKATQGDIMALAV